MPRCQKGYFGVCVTVAGDYHFHTFTGSAQAHKTDLNVFLKYDSLLYRAYTVCIIMPFSL